MKKLIPVLLLLWPSIAGAQTQQDYEQTMALFMKYYNTGDSAGICRMFRPDIRSQVCDWPGERLKEFGSMASHEFVGIDTASKSGNPVRVFKVRYSPGEVRAMSFSLRKNPAAAAGSVEPAYIFGTFTFIDMTPRIEQMVQRAR
jgi:hypothetical protein